MSNYIKSGTTTLTSAVRGNVYVGIEGLTEYGPTNNTGFYAGITPPIGGYTIYVAKAEQGPSIHVAHDDNQCIFFLKSFGSTGSTISDVLSWASNQSNMWIQTGLISNNLPNNFITSGLLVHLDANNINSYIGSGTTINDVSGNQNTSSLINGAVFNEFVGGTIRLDGVDDYIDIPYNSTLDLPTTRTVSLWFKLNSKTTFQTLIGQSNTGASKRKWEVRYGAASANDNKIRVILGQGSPQTNIDSTLSYDLTTKWYNLVVGYDGPSTTLNIYLDTNLIGSSTSTFSNIYSSVTNGDNTLGFNIGRRQGGFNSVNGNIANFSVYNRMLNSTEVIQNFNSLKSRFGIV